MEDFEEFPVGYSGELWFLWCPEHGNFWSEGKYDACSECGYRCNVRQEEDK